MNPSVMIRVLIYVLIIFALAAGFAWLADNPGSVTFSFQEFDVRTTVMAAAILAVAVLVVGRLLWLFLRALLRAPKRLGRQVADRRRELGSQALTQGFIAVGSGDASVAAHYAAESRYYAQAEPLTLLLAAQTAQLTGDDMGARSAFEAMLTKPETRVLGLRGLFLEARRRGDAEAARSFAAAADREKPGLAWAGPALLEYHAADGEWAAALETVASLTGAGAMDAERAKRFQAVLRVARAMELEDSDPAAARDLALEAHRLAPALVPAAVVASRLATRLGDSKRTAKVLETAWRIEPHPELAQAYMDARPGDSGRDRMKRVRHLTKIRANHLEGQLALARVAVDAQEWAVARQELGGVLATHPTERVYLLMAEIEEREHDDIGRARDWLGRALRAPRDPSWMADGYVFDHWQPVSPITGRIDAFEWKAPAERLAAPEETHDDLELAQDALLPAVISAEKEPAAAANGADEAEVNGGETIDGQPANGGGEEEKVDHNHQPDDPGPTPDADPAPAASKTAKGKRFKLFSS